MATNIIHKKSSVAGKQPNDSSDLVYGELAINYQDGYLYYKDTSNTIRKFMDSAKTQGLIDNELNTFVTPTSRAAISVVSNGTDGSLAYNNSTGVITYTGIIDSDVRSRLSATGDIAYNQSTGVFSATTYKTANHDSDFNISLATKTTANLAENTNLYFTNTRADARVQAVHPNTGSLSEGSNLYYTDARADARVQTRLGSNLKLGDSAGNFNYVYPQTFEGLSWNQNAQYGDSNHTVYHFGGDSSRDTIVSVGKNDQFNHAIGVKGTAAANDFIIGFDGHATNFRIQKTVGSTYDLSAGTDVFSIDSEGRANIPSAQAATNKTTGALVIAGGLGVSGDIKASDIETSGNVQAQGSFIGNVTGQISTLSNHNTGALSEGTNLYYLKSRADSDIDSAFDSRNTGGLSEGSNLYYTTARADSDAKNSISVVDGGGDGALSYNAATGVISYTGPTPEQTRAHLSGGTGVGLASNGAISIGQAVGVTDSATLGGLGVNGDVQIFGDLFVSGSQVQTASSTLSINSSMIRLADSNTADTVDIGIIGRYSEDGGTTIKRTGFIRDASNGEFYVFDGLVQDGIDSGAEFDQTVNVGGTGWNLPIWNFGGLRGQYLGFDSDFRVFQSDYKVKTADYTAVAGDRLAINTSGGAFTVTLPASPVTGNTVRFIDIGNWNGTNYLDVARNGNTIEGAADNFRLDIGQNTVDFIFINSTWNVYAAIGQVGPTGPQGAAGINADSDTLNQNAIAYAIALG